jgi:hypothetical protein
MNTEELDQALRATLADGRLSRSERQALADVLNDTAHDSARLAQLRARAFVMARERTTDPRALEALGWVEELVKLLAHVDAPAAAGPSRAYFSPGEACLSAILGHLGQAQSSLDPSPSWVEDLLDTAVRRVLGESFPPTPNDHCARCTFRRCCPAQPDGRQVVQ